MTIPLRRKTCYINLSKPYHLKVLTPLASQVFYILHTLALSMNTPPQTETMYLGKTIELRGGSCVDRNTLLILTKLIGFYGHMISEKTPYQKLVIELRKDPNGYTTTAAIQVEQNMYHFQWSNPNIFVSVDTAIKNLQLQLKNQ